ncbi:MAG: ATP-dependent Lhr-like helicase, partial [Gammaproteobacteria bacterium]
ELQAAANEDSIILSLGETHSFPLADTARFLSSNSVRDVLIQALLDAPVFNVRWRWNANISLAIPRFRSGKKVPAQIQRMQAEDLIAVVFPDQIACLENISGPRQVPDHPLVQQTIHDALNEAMDIDGLENVLRRLEAGALTIVACDLTEPSPLTAEILTANPYTFLDDAPAEERRTRAVSARRHVTIEDAAQMGQITTDAINRVRAECTPTIRDADELHDALVLLGCMTEHEVARELNADAMLAVLARDRRAARVTQIIDRSADGLAHAASPDTLHESSVHRELPEHRPRQERVFIVAAERWDEFHAVHPRAIAEPTIAAPKGYEFSADQREQAIIELLRGRMQSASPITAVELSRSLALPLAEVVIALTHLESEGLLLRGNFSAQRNSRNGAVGAAEHWCERRLLARIHRYSLTQQRERARPVSSSALMRFLLDWQFLSPNTRLAGPAGLARILDRLDGVEAPAACWESEVLPARMLDFEAAWLDHLCLAGRAAWLRILPTSAKEKPQTNKPLSSTPIALTSRRNMALFARSASAPSPNALALRVLEHLELRGACFFDELVAEFALAPMSLEQALIALVANGQVTCDGFAGLRALIARRTNIRLRAHHPPRPSRLTEAGRWSRIAVPARPSDQQQARLHELECAERVARVLLLRYGVLFKRLVEREITTVPWRDLLRCLRRMEARGEIRGGRFVDGFAGEQFALPEAAQSLALRRDPIAGEEPICVAATDPMNLTGIITACERVPARRGNRILYRDGIPIAARVGKELQQFTGLSEEEQWQARLLLFGHNPGHPAVAQPNLFARPAPARLL